MDDFNSATSVAGQLNTVDTAGRIVSTKILGTVPAAKPCPTCGTCPTCGAPKAPVVIQPYVYPSYVYPSYVYPYHSVSPPSYPLPQTWC